MKKPSRLRIFVAEDHPIVCSGFEHLAKQFPHWKIEGFAGTAAGALDACRRLPLDLLVVDLSLTEGDGLALIIDARKIRPDIRILVMSLYSEDEFARRAFLLGASGYVMKNRGMETIGEAIEVVASGRFFFSEHLLATLGSEDPGARKGVADLLTPREVRIFHLIGQGFSAATISRELKISVKTVEAHRENIKNKLNLNTALELNQRAYAWVWTLQNRFGVKPLT
jgi:DNA-binding NarL/FixJ family response regulator